jgi:hypothetical protein
MGDWGLRCVGAFVAMLIVAVAVLVGSVQAAASEASWSPPVTVPGSVGADPYPTDAVDAKGDVLAAWERHTLAGEAQNIVQVAFRGAGHRFAAPVTLSRRGDVAGAFTVAFDRFGNAIAAWDERGISRDTMRVAIRPRGGRFDTPITLSGTGDVHALNAPSVAFDAAGDAFVLWSVNGRAAHGVQLAVRPHGGHFGAPVTLSGGTGGASAPRLAVDARGDMLALWRQCTNRASGCDEGRQLLEAAWRLPGGPVRAPVVISGSIRYPISPQVAIGGPGDAVVVWTGRFFAQYSVASPGGTFSAAATLADDVIEAQIAMDGAGNAIAAWVEQDPAAPIGSDERVQAAVLPTGASSFAAAQNVSPEGGDATDTMLAMNPRGDAALAWSQCPAQPVGCNAAPLQAATRHPGQPFGAPVTLSPSAQPALAIGPSGQAVAVWDNEIKKVGRVDLATYRFTG